MSVINNNLLLTAPAAASGYQVSRSLRFNSPDSAYLGKIFASAGNRKTWTWAGWVKRSKSALQMLFNSDGGTTDSTFGHISITASDQIRIGAYSVPWRETTAVYRDYSAWYHIVVCFDTTQATANNRVRLYVNGAEVTTFSTLNNPTQNTDYAINQAAGHYIGSSYGSYGYFDGYLADIYFIDGQALDPSSFTTTDATTGQLIPKAFSGTYGTNGWHLEFADNSAATATTLGKDTSGNGNNWSCNNLSVTAGAGNDSLVDVPTNGSQVDSGIGNEVRGNYCTLNPLDGSSSSISNGCLQISSSSGYQGARGTFGISSGKWYWEQSVDVLTSTNAGLYQVNGGVVLSTHPYASGTGLSGMWGFQNSNGSGTNSWKFDNGTGTNSYTVFAQGDIAGLALDMNAGKLDVYRNGTFLFTCNNNLSGQTVFPLVQAYVATTSVNFGQRPFAYPVAGYKCLNTASLPSPSVTKPSTVMDVALYTGNGGTQTISGLGFSPDLVWIKARSYNSGHALWDTIRGALQYLGSESTSAELTIANTLTSFNSNGFSLGSYSGTNGSSTTYAAWTWDAGSSTVTNTQGSITGTVSVRANTTAGFSIVTYTGNGTSGATVGHGLGVAPSLIIVKRRNVADSWLVYTKETGATKYLLLNNTTAASTYSGAWNDTAPTSTVFSLGNDVGVNANTGTYVAYCFAPVVGYSSFGSYIGTSGQNFVNLGFRPKLLLIKNSSNGSYPAYTGWAMFDSSRSTYNVNTNALWANSSQQEGLRGNGSAASSPDFAIDMLSNGFCLRDNGASEINLSGNTYIYCAWAESPFNYARAR